MNNNLPELRKIYFYVAMIFIGLSPNSKGFQASSKQIKMINLSFGEIMTDAITSRDLHTLRSLFVSEDVFARTIKRKSQLGSYHDDYVFQRELFLKDCDRILDRIPSVEGGQIKLILLEEVKIDSNPALDGNSSVYRIRFSLLKENKTVVFEIITPSLIIEDNNVKCISRFWYPLRFLADK